MAHIVRHKLYNEKKVSIGKMAQELDLSVNEVLDLLSDFGIEFR